jgi:hypothetical protein
MMPDSNGRRVSRPLAPAEQDRLSLHRQQIADELPDLAAKDRLRQEAQAEPTLSGELRRSIHRSPLSLTAIADASGIPPLQLDEFLTGERTLQSDVLDRLARALGFVPQLNN